MSMSLSSCNMHAHSCFSSLDQISHVGRQLLNDSVVEALDVLHHPLVIPGDEVNGNTLASEASRTTNAVQVVLGLGGQVVVDDQRHLLHINAAGQQISGDEHTGRAGAELAHDHVAGVLVHVSVSGGDSVVPLAHLVSKPVHLPAGVGKNDRLGDSQGLVQIAQCVQLPVLLLNIDVELLDTLQSQLITLDQNANGLVHELAGDLQGLRGQSGREHTDLQLGGQELEDVIDLVLETPGKHLIGLVKDEHLDVVSPQAAPAEHIIDATRGANNNVHASTQDASILTDASATHAGVALHLQVVTEGPHDLLNLLSKLTGGSQHQSLALLSVVVQVV
mmetsp:Transcript_21792/g.47600  ORF Transcript_21792/g.47600 Transcript_21792/m.47600 type:complete len:334 (-) Transcript_21792:324-1325(-)